MRNYKSIKCQKLNLKKNTEHQYYNWIKTAALAICPIGVTHFRICHITNRSSERIIRSKHRKMWLSYIIHSCKQYKAIYHEILSLSSEARRWQMIENMNVRFCIWHRLIGPIITNLTNESNRSMRWLCSYEITNIVNMGLKCYVWCHHTISLSII